MFLTTIFTLIAIETTTVALFQIGTYDRLLLLNRQLIMSNLAVLTDYEIDCSLKFIEWLVDHKLFYH